MPLIVDDNSVLVQLSLTGAVEDVASSRLFAYVSAIHRESLYESFVESVCILFTDSSSDISELSSSTRYRT